MAKWRFTATPREPVPWGELLCFEHLSLALMDAMSHAYHARMSEL